MSETSPARVFLVDDHPIVRDGFRMLLESDDGFTVAGEAGSGEEALEQLPEAGADLVVVDISMEEIGGIELTRRLTEGHLTEESASREGAALQVLVVSMHGETRYVEEAFEAGARGYVLKDNVHALLLDAAREVLDGGAYLDPGLDANLNL